MSTTRISPESVQQTLQRALSAAQAAVKLDEANRDTMAIVEAYRRSISLLDHVISRHPIPDEVDRLTDIRATYSERIQVLMLSRTIPVVAQQSTETLIKTSIFPSKSTAIYVLLTLTVD
ncbi:hypothetical protein C8R45DRAFT_1086122 [Mycena sanguinolenta]|nr:hypothetical protein C8R45DRAFT_1086122 [Mycena sanguinolenta]